ncbi:MAG TPA: helix-turn-helix domain-containing protein [Solirubrobacterales bacterium]
MNPVTEQPTAEKPLRADARRNRERVLAAARKCFGEQGYETQMTDVARKAGVGVGTVYRHFPDKTALVEALVAERFRQFTEGARKALEVEDAWAGFREWLWRCGEIQAEDRMVCDFITEAVGAERREAIAEDEGLAEATRAVIAHAKDAGAIRETVEPEDIPTMMCGLGAVARSEDDPSGRVWRRHLEFMLDGLRDPSYSAK